MLQVNVEARCTAGQILSHPWVSVSTHVPRGMRTCVLWGQQRASLLWLFAHAELGTQTPRQGEGLLYGSSGVKLGL